MKYLKAVSQMFKINYKSLLIFWAAIAGGALFGGIIETIINLLSDESLIGMGILFAGIFFGIIVVFGSVLSGYSDFAFAVYFNRARDEFILAKYLFLVVEYGIGMLIVGITFWIEKSFVKPETDFIGAPSHVGFLACAVILAVPVIVSLFSALYAKFEKKFFWFMWCLWMIVMVGGPRIVTAMDKYPESVAAKIGNAVLNFLNIGSTASIIGAIVITLICAVLNVVIYRNIDVRD